MLDSGSQVDCQGGLRKIAGVSFSAYTKISKFKFSFRLLLGLSLGFSDCSPPGWRSGRQRDLNLLHPVGECV